VAAAPILEVRDLVVEYGGNPGLVAVDHVNLEVRPGEFLSLVGESGCGKSTLLYSIAQLLSPPAEITGGEIMFKGRNLVHLREKELRHLRWRDYSVVMQSAMNALNPVLSIGAQFEDAVKAHEKSSSAEIRAHSAQLLRMVGIDPIHLHSYPHQLSGGMRQRAMIAMALLFTPDLIIMDEPTSALDVVAQRSLMMQIEGLQNDFGFALIFVTHDMSLVGRFSDRIAIMYAAQIVEVGATRQVFAAPKHPYTSGLLQAFPSIYGPRQELKGIPGSPPDLRFPPSGCRFHPRCPHCTPANPALHALQTGTEPRLREVAPGQLAACHLYPEGGAQA
jgi:peptide/nickel transport system ATP-binding protein